MIEIPHFFYYFPQDNNRQKEYYYYYEMEISAFLLGQEKLFFVVWIIREAK